MRIRLVILGLISALAPQPASALLCGTFLEPVRVTGTGLNFGPYFPAQPDLHIDGKISVDCGLLSLDLLPDFTVKLLGGNAGNPSARYMLNGAAHLNYAVYSSGTTVWDDNLGAVSYTSLLNLSSVSFFPHGVIFSGQYVAQGAYNDTLTVEVDY